MTDRHHRFLDRLDRLAGFTGVPALAMALPRRRHLRWLPLAALVLASAGLLWSLLNPGRSFGIGYALIMTGMTLANLLPIWGPLRRFNEPADEFERMQRRDSYLVGFATIATAGLAGVWLTAAMLATGTWSAATAWQELFGIGIYMMALFSSVPTLHASWRTRPIADED